MNNSSGCTRYFFILIFFVAGCVDRIDIPIRDVEPKLVVDGMITTDQPPYSVRLSFSGQFSWENAQFENEMTNNAMVTITEDSGRSVQLFQNPSSPIYYATTDSTFRGRTGHSYTLNVRLADGREFESTSEMLSEVAPIHNLSAKYLPSKDGYLDPSYYQVMVNTLDPEETGNYYRWSALVYSPRWGFGVPSRFDIVNLYPCHVATSSILSDVLSDAYINGNYISQQPVLKAPVYATGRHYVEVQQYSISRKAYQYWNQFDKQRTRSGSLFDALPASIEGNVHQKSDTTILALGYFGASDISRKRMVIPGDTINYNWFVIRYGGLFEGDCSPAPSDSELAEWNK